MQTLRTYINFLNDCAEGLIDAPQFDPETKEEKIIILLRNEGLVEFFGTSVLGPPEKVILTPKGALALSEWESKLKKDTFLHKLGENFLRLLWVLVGALVASITGLMQCL